MISVKAKGAFIAANEASRASAWISEALTSNVSIGHEETSRCKAERPWLEIRVKARSSCARRFGDALASASSPTSVTALHQESRKI